MIRSTADFIRYFESLRRRTLNYARLVPPDRLGWSPDEGEFTCADILRHILATERMFVRVALEGRWNYEGYTAGEEGGLDELLALFETTHAEAMRALAQLPDADLDAPRPGPKREGQSLKDWRWLMAMA